MDRDRHEISVRPVRSTDGPVAMVLCKKESAEHLIKGLQESGIGATLSGAEPSGESPDGTEYTACQIDISPAVEHDVIWSAIKKWPEE